MLNRGDIAVDVVTGEAGRVGEQIYPGTNHWYRKYGFQRWPGDCNTFRECRLRKPMPGELRAFRRRIAALPRMTWGIFCIPIEGAHPATPADGRGE